MLADGGVAHPRIRSGADLSSSGSRRCSTSSRRGAACVAVEGEPGIGKTRLLAELRRRAEARGHLVLAGSAAEFERDLPYGVWVDALDAYVASQELSSATTSRRVARRPRRRAAVAASDGARRHGRRRASPGASRDPRAAGAIAERKPLVLVLDDLHWSDAASVELLAALLRRGTARARPARARLPHRTGARELGCGARRADGHGDRARPVERGRVPQLAGAHLGGAARGDLHARAAATRSTRCSSRTPPSCRRAARPGIAWRRTPAFRAWSRPRWSRSSRRSPPTRACC